MKKEIKIGNIKIGANHPIAIQSMTNTNTKDIQTTYEQIKLLKTQGCDIVRVAVYDIECAKAIYEIKKLIDIPIVADIHFDYRLAIESIRNGADKIRINPGNIGDETRVRAIIDEAKKFNIPIRVGANSGSLPKDILNKFKAPNAQAVVEAAMQQVKILEKYNFYDIVISVKSSDIRTTIDSYRLLNEISYYPLHVGLTEAGTFLSGSIKSSIAIGTLLLEGIGDTIRVSLTDDPVNEVIVAKEILKSLGLRKGINIISCPTCARCRVNLIEIAKMVENKIKDLKTELNVAIMGCAVNGPGEAKEADIGLACGNKEGLIFKKGKIIRKVKEEIMVEELLKEIDELLGKKGDIDE